MNRLLKDLNFKVYTTDLQKSDESGRRIIRGYASVSDVLDRQNEIITHSALVRAKSDLLENNTVFYEHKHSELPIGKTVAVDIDEKGLLVTVEFTKAPFANDIWTLIEEGTLNSFSIGGRVLDAEEKRDKGGNLFNEITKIELFEVSVVGLPANPEAKFKLVSKSFNMAITEEMKRREGEMKMSKDENKKDKDVNSSTASTDVESTFDSTSNSQTDNYAATVEFEAKIEKSSEEIEVEENDSNDSQELKSQKLDKQNTKKQSSEEQESEGVEETKKSSDESEENEINEETTEDSSEKSTEHETSKNASTGVTTMEDGHWHTLRIDDEGNGQTEGIVGPDPEAHVHQVIKGVVQEADGHTHEVSELVRDETQELESEEEMEASVETSNEKSSEEVQEDIQKEESLTGTPSNEENISEEESEENTKELQEEQEDIEELEVEEKSTDEQILEILSGILQEMKSSKEQVSEKSTEEEQKEPTVEEDKNQKEEYCECDKSEEIEVNKSKDESDTQKKEIEKSESKKEIKLDKTEDNKEDKIPTRKGEVIIAQAPYSNDNDDGENKVDEKVLSKLREKAWAKIVFGK